MKNKCILNLWRKFKNPSFKNSREYWETRYKNKGTSGIGSYGKNAEYKARVINEFVIENNVKTVIEFGCGDGNQLKSFVFPEYIGLDVSPTAISDCKKIFEADPGKKFFLYQSESGSFLAEGMKNADLVISLDVIFHLVEDPVFEKYMTDLFQSSSKYVIIYAWDVNEQQKYHVRQRNYSEWISGNIDNFHLIEHIPPDIESHFCDFFIYKKNDRNPVFS